MEAIQRLVSTRYRELNANLADAELREEVRAVADVILDLEPFHSLRRAVIRSVSSQASSPPNSGPPEWLLEAVGEANHAQLNVADGLMKQLMVATMEQIAFVQTTTGKSTSIEPREPLSFMSDRRLPLPVRRALLARFRIEVFSVAVMSTKAFAMDKHLLPIVLDEWIRATRTYLGYVTSLPGVTAKDGIEPMNLAETYRDYSRVVELRAGGKKTQRNDLN